jgi:hypothetical protein
MLQQSLLLQHTPVRICTPPVGVALARLLEFNCCYKIIVIYAIELLLCNIL